MQVLAILFATVFTFAVCLAAGKLMLRLLRIQLYRSEELFFGFLLGAPCLSTVVFVLGTVGCAYTSVFLITGCAVLALAWRCRALSFTTRRLASLARQWKMLFTAIYSVFAILYLVAALSPESSPDGAVYHVALPALYLRQHRIPSITTNLIANLSEGIEMLYLFAFAFGKHSAASMVHLLFTLLTPLGMLSYAKRIGSPRAGVVGGLLFFLSPAVALVGTAAYVDVAAAAATFGVFYLLQIWWVEQRDSLLIPLGILSGFGYAIKYTAGIAVLYLIGGIFLREARLGRPRGRRCATVCLTAFAVMAPWIVKNAIVLGNPVAPFANRIFPNPYVYVPTERDYAAAIGSLNGLPMRAWPYEITTRGARTQGFLGPVFLLAPLALLSLTTAAGRQLLCAAAVFLIPCLAASGSRYVLPSLTFVSLALGLAVSRYAWTAISVILLHTLLCWPAIIPKYAHRNAPRLGWPDWRAALRLKPESEYLSSRLDGYRLGQLLEAKLAPNEQALGFQFIEQAYHSRQALAAWTSALGVRLGESLRAAIDPSLQPTERHLFSFASTAASKIRLLQTSGNTTATQWSISELRIFRDDQELPRAASWRLRASPNPWDVQLAFDSSPLTRWASRQPAAGGMFIEVDFGESQTVNNVTADCVPNQPGVTMSVQIERSPGNWQEVPSKLEVTQTAMPPRLRRAAIEELERHDIHALVIHDLDPGARDFRLRQSQWGIELAGVCDRHRLYLLR